MKNDVQIFRGTLCTSFSLSTHSKSMAGSTEIFATINNLSVWVASNSSVTELLGPHTFKSMGDFIIYI